MNYVINFILFNLLLIGLLYYNKKLEFILILFMIIYWITINNKAVDGFSFYSEDEAERIYEYGSRFTIAAVSTNQEAINFTKDGENVSLDP